MMATDQLVIPVVVEQHAEDAAMLRHVRSVLLRAPHVQLHRLLRLDERIAAHLDGIAEAGAYGLRALEAQLASPTVGGVFALTVCALQRRDAGVLTRMVQLAAAVPEVQSGFLSAMGWVSAEDLQGTVRALLGSKDPCHRAWGLAACAMHRVDPGALLTHAVQDADLAVRVRAWRVAGQLGRRDLADAARQAIAAPAPTQAVDEHATVIIDPKRSSTTDQSQGPLAVRGAAAWALTLWGEGNNDPVRQSLIALQDERDLPCPDAHRLAILGAPVQWGRDQIRALAAQAESSPCHKRRMMRLAGWVGDPQIIPWLIQQMAHGEWTRLAGESFSMITGADLVQLQLSRTPPDGAELGPNDDPEDQNVALDEDEDLPWPDQAKVQAWWQANAHHFVPGQRYFVGELPSIRLCMQALRAQGQRQRIIAAEHLCLLRPGGKLFPVAAPAWRQSRWLAEEEAALS